MSEVKAQYSERSTAPQINSEMLNLRINTENLLSEIQQYLSGTKRIVTIDDNNNLTHQTIKLGVSKLNKDGVESLMLWLRCAINPHTVQGNFYSDARGNSERFDKYLENFQKNLGYYISSKQPEWEMIDEDYQGIIDTIMLMVEPFFSRLIDNEERKSYSKQFQHVESSTQTESGGLNFFRK